MNIGLFYYDRFANHEIIIACHEFRRHSIYSIGIDRGIYESTERQRIAAEYSITEIDPELLDVFIVPGGVTDAILENKELLKYINELNKKKRIIAGICGGTFILAKSGVLNNKKCTGHFIEFEDTCMEKAYFKSAKLINEDVVVDDNVVTARGKAFIEFGLILAQTAGVLNEEQFSEEYLWLKNRI